MTKRALLYRVLLYIVTLSIIVCGGFLYNSLKMQKMWSSSVQSVVDADGLYDSRITNIYPDGGEISLWDGTSSEAPAGLGDEYEPYLIASAANLNYFRANAASFNNKYIKQTVNIDLQGNPWTPIVEGTYFYDGNGKSIYNLYINTTHYHVGIFERFNTTSYMKNLNIIGETIIVDNTSTTSSMTRVGSIVGACYCSTGSTIKNVHVTDAKISVKSKARCEVGGLHGGAEYLVDDGNSFSGNIYVEETADTGIMVGGIVGGMNRGVQILNCSSFGNVFGYTPNTVSQTGSEIGGIVGADYGSSPAFYINNCVSYMNVQASSGQQAHAGGIIGVLCRYPDSQINNCASYGNIYSISTAGNNIATAGGIGGYVGNATITNSKSYGSVFADLSTMNASAGGIAGHSVGTKISNCYSACKVLGKDYNGNDRQAAVGGIAGSIAASETKIAKISYCLFTGSVADYDNDISCVGALVGYVYGGGVGTSTIDYSYWDTSVLASGGWETAYYISDTTKAIGYNAGGATVTGCAGSATSAIKIATPTTQPSAVSRLTSNWDFTVFDAYPTPKNIPDATRLVASTKNVRLLMDTSTEAYNGQEQQKDVQICTYELKGFENTDPTSCWDGVSVTKPNGKGTSADPYLIESAANLAWVSANAQTADGIATNKHYKQVVNIDLNNMLWKPIGPGSSAVSIYYDGNCHTIKNLYVKNVAGVTYSALFGNVSTGFVRNLGIESGKIVSSANAASLICAITNLFFVSNCYNKATVYGSTSIGGLIGGVSFAQGIGYAYPIVYNCWNAGNIYANNYSYVGGIVAYNMRIPIKNCINTGNIYLQKGNNSAVYIGGCIGYDSMTGTLKRAFLVNYGDIIATGEGKINGRLALTYIGGVIGSANYAFQNCYNFGSLAGIVGYSTRGGALAGAAQSLTDMAYNKDYIGFNITTQKYGTTDTTYAKATSELIVSTEGTAPSGVTSNENWNYFVGQYPIGKPETNKMTFYQKLVDENQTKPDISYWNGLYDSDYIVAPTLGNPDVANGADNPYIIDSAAKLAYLSVNPSFMQSKYFMQTVDIDLCGYKWTPIAGSAVSSFLTYYDGFGHTIYNLYISSRGLSGNFGVGFIDKLGNGYIKNLTFNSGKVECFSDFSGTTWIGAFVGQTGSPTIQNCHNIGVTVQTQQIACIRLGGVVGEAYWGTQIINCSNSGKVINYGCNYPAVGGICGNFYAQTSEGNPGNITNCINYGYVQSISLIDTQLGGIAGLSYIGRVNFTGCENYGDCYCITFGQECCSGGIVGHVYNSEGPVTITKCFNSGNIKGIEYNSANPNVGGIAGVMVGTSSAGAKTISNSISVGSVATAPGMSINYSGGVVGTISGEYHQLTNCYYNYEKVSSGHWDGSTTYLSTSNDIQYLYGQRGDGGSAINMSGCAQRSTSAMKSLADASAPSGLTALSSSDWTFTKNDYPHLRSISEENVLYDASPTFVRALATKQKDVVSVWDGSTEEYPLLLYGGTQNCEANPYIIDNAAKLAYISKYPSNMNGCYIKQTVDINLNNKAWTPINSGASNYTYYYDGDNHTIYNINVSISNSGHQYGGLFGLIAQGGYVKNLTMSGGRVFVCSTTGFSSAGAIVGQIYTESSTTLSLIENCHNMNVEIDGQKQGSSNIACTGGLAGSVYYTTIKDCSNSGFVHTSNMQTATYTGGIVGRVIYGSSILNCQNNAEVIAMGGTNGSGGGIVGRCDNTGIYNNSVQYCENHGKILTISKTGGSAASGGIVGSVVEQLIVSNCFNTGEILTFEDQYHAPSAGGIVGRATCSANGQLLVTYCYSIGAVGVWNSTAMTRIGGIFGESGTYDYIKIRCCYYNYETVSAGTDPEATYLTSRNNIADLYGLAPGNNTTIESCSPLTTALMQGLTTSMSGFPSDVWEYSANDYPRLKSKTQQKSVWDGSSSVKPYGAGTETNPYIIESASNLAYLSAHYSDSDIVGKYFRQVVDIDLNWHNWHTINNETGARTYYYDGNNHTIYNFYINENSNTQVFPMIGLFGFVNNGYIKNLTLENGKIEYINTDNGGGYACVGAFVGYRRDGVFALENCHNKGVDIEVSLYKYLRVGGLIGDDDGNSGNGGGSVNILNCSNSGNISAIKNGGTGEVRVGGIIGVSLDGMTIQNCVNYGYIRGYCNNWHTLIGGILGCTGGGGATINNCANFGDVYGATVGDDTTAGGIVGNYVASGNPVSVTNCFNSGNVRGYESSTATPDVGGIIGGAYGLNSTITATISYCISVGSVSTIGNQLSYVGGVIGWTNTTGDYVYCSNCYYNYSTVDQGNWGETNVYYLPATNTADLLYGNNAVRISDVAPLSMSEISVTSSGTVPSGLTGFTTDNWNFVAGNYPLPKGVVERYENKISFWDGSSSSAPAGDGSAVNPYKIATAANLKWVSVNSLSMNGKYFVQTADIDLRGFAWTPICGFISSVGVIEIRYDGNNHTVYNVNASVSGTYSQICGLFGQICNNSYIKNLTVENATINATSTNGHVYVGALVGSVDTNHSTGAEQAYIINCHAKNVKITGSCASTGHNYIGALAGWALRTHFIDCSASGTFEFSITNTGGISSIGAIVGDVTTSGSIENCVNYCDIIKTNVNYSGPVYLGGITAGTTSGKSLIIKNCINYGSIQFGSSSGDVRVAGIAPWFNGIKYINCINYGYIFGQGTGNRAYVGGMGSQGSNCTVDNCYNYGDIYSITTGVYSQASGIIANSDDNVTITNCFNAGNILAEGGSESVCSGGIAGGFDSATSKMVNCFSVGSVGYRNTLATVYAGGLCIAGSSSTVLKNCYYNKDTVASGNWAERGITGVSYMSTTSNLPWGNGTTPTNTNVSGLTTNQMKSSADKIRPSGMVGFTQEKWDFVKNEYPSLGLIAYNTTYSGNINVGTANVTVALGKGSGYIGVVGGSFAIQKGDNHWIMYPNIANYAYNSAVSLLIARSYFGEYTAVFKDSNNEVVEISPTSNAGTYSIVLSVAGTSNYNALQTTITFDVIPCDITNNSNITITLDPDEFVYDGQPKTPDPTVTYGS